MVSRRSVYPYNVELGEIVMPVLYLKLNDGEDVIADCEETNGGMKLKGPARLIPTPQGLGMMPMNPFIVDKEITLPQNFIVYTGTPDDEIKNAWNQKFGNGLIVPGSGLLHG
jgi:hypothetical protein